MGDKLVNIKLPPKGRKCVVKDCKWHVDEVMFFGELCPECYTFLTGRSGGEFSQAFRNAMGAAAKVLLGNSTHLMAGKILENYANGNLVYRR